MRITPGEIEGLFIIEPKIHSDDRGYFFESFHQNKLEEALGYEILFVQDNESLSSKGILRGLHLQSPPYGQSKLVRVIQGAVIDVAVDVRKNSSTYGKYQMVELSASNKKQFFVPVGFAHGFITLEDNTIFQYKCSNYYHPESELGIKWDDPELNIEWPKFHIITSKKDQLLPLFNQFKTPY